MIPLETGLYALLSADSALGVLAPGGVHKMLAPSATADPFIVFQPQQPGLEDHFLGAQTVRRIESFEYVVKGVCSGESAMPADLIEQRVYELLNDTAALAVSGYTLMRCRRVGRIAYPETADGITYFHAGGRYAIEVTP